MATLKLTRDDRKWLRSLRIDPQESVEEAMFDVINAPPKYLPNKIIISHELARKVLAEYGELTIETVWAYRNKFQA